RRMVSYLIDTGVHGIWASGTTGEFANLSDTERLVSIETVVDEVAGRVPVIANVSAPSTAATISLGRSAGRIGVAGVAPESIVIPLRVSTTGDDFREDWVWTAAQTAIDALAEYNIRVANWSFGGPEPSLILRDAAVQLINNDIIVIGAGGNDAEDDYPGMYPEVIAIGAVDFHDRKPSWWYNDDFFIEFLAPADNIYTTGAQGVSHYDPAFWGTSAAAAVVSGVAALLRASDPSLGVGHTKIILKSETVQLYTFGEGYTSKHRRVDAGFISPAIDTYETNPPTSNVFVSVPDHNLIVCQKVVDAVGPHLSRTLKVLKWDEATGSYVWTTEAIPGVPHKSAAEEGGRPWPMVGYRGMRAGSVPTVLG
ncbi:dihydrodipicolinate synthase family protein, partial [bacterium]|nr:dihydrodipicolinate synthase family protein [bacterium]